MINLRGEVGMGADQWNWHVRHEGFFSTLLWVLVLSFAGSVQAAVDGPQQQPVTPQFQGSISHPGWWSSVYHERAFHTDRNALCSALPQTVVPRPEGLTCSYESGETCKCTQGYDASIHSSCPAGYAQAYEDVVRYGSNQLCRPIRNYVAPEKNQAGKPAENACAGNPINLNSANKYQFEQDYVAAGSSGLQFSRHYNHSIETKPSLMGARWRHDFDRSIEIGRSAALTSARVYRPDGRILYFSLNDGLWSGDPDIADRLAALPQGGWRYSVADDLSTEDYDANGRLFQISDAYGKRLNLSYDERGRLQTVSDRYGRQLKLTHDAAGLLNEVLTPSGTTLRYSHDSKGRLNDVTQVDGSIRRYLYEDPNPDYLTGIVDENGARFATWRYAAGQAVGSEHGDGAGKVSIAYDGSARVTDALGTTRVTRFETILGVRRTISQSQPPGSGCPAASSTIEYDAWGNPILETDFKGNRTVREWDSRRNLEISRTIAAGMPEQKTIRTTWHDTLRLPVSIVEGNLDTTFEYDAAGRMTAMTQRGVNTKARNWRYDYDADGLLIASTSPENGSYRYTYDAMGNLNTIIDAAGRMTSLSDYDANGRVGRILATDGVAFTITYTARGLPLSITRTGRGLVAGLPETTLYRHDAAGQLTGLTSPDGSSFAFTYDTAHRLTRIADKSGNAIMVELDAMGNRVVEKLVGPNGEAVQTVRRQIDALNRIKQVDDGRELPWRYEYDANGQLASVTDPLSRTSRYRYDAMKRLIGVTLPQTPFGAVDGSAPAPSASIAYAYGERDELASITDPRGLVTRYGLNVFGDRTSVVSPDTGTMQYNIDGRGQLVGKADARNQETRITRDSLGRIIQLDYSSGTPTRFAYENGSDRLATMVDESGNTIFDYDGLGHLLGKAQVFAGGIRLGLRYNRQPGGKIGSLTYPSGNRILYTTNGNGRVSALALERPGMQDAKPLMSDIAYRPFGAPFSWTWGNGLAYQRSHDPQGRLFGYPIAPTVWRTMSHDPAGQILDYRDVSASGEPPSTQTFTYDEQGRLFDANFRSRLQRFRYDANGNRTSVSYDDASFTNTIAADSNRLLSSTGPVAQRNTYDAAGNLIGDGAMQFEYSARGRLASTTMDGLTSTYLYNGQGDRVQKTVTPKGFNHCTTQQEHGAGSWLDFISKQFNSALAAWENIGSGSPTEARPSPASSEPCKPGSVITAEETGRTTYYVYDDQHRLLGEYDGSGLPIQETVYLDDTPVAVIKPGAGGSEVFYIYPDHLDTPRGIVNEANELVWRWDHGDPFGVIEPNANPSEKGIFQYNLRFPGQVADEETNLISNGARFYDALHGRYLQSDPIGLDGGINTYSYALDNPVGYTDPTGQIVPLAIAGVCAAGVCETLFASAGGIVWWALNHNKLEGPIRNDSGNEKSCPPRPNFDWNDPSVPPKDADGTEWPWRGPDAPGGSRGGYVNPNNPEQSAHPDLNHPAPVGPHWDFTDRKTGGWRIYPDGSVRPK